jgi:hypothetical protein
MMAVQSVMCYTAYLRMLLRITNYIEANSPVISPRDAPLVVGQALVDQSLLTIEASRLHSVAESAFGNSSGRVISPTHSLYLTHNTHKRQTSMPPAGFEPAIPKSE